MGERLVLPVAADGPFTIGLLGTRSIPQVKRKTKTEVLAEALARLAKPIYLVDVRRDGVGSQSSWSPRELASLVPAAMQQWATVHRRSSQPYGFWHLPCLAPSIQLLALWRKATELFRKVERLRKDIVKASPDDRSMTDLMSKLDRAKNDLDEHVARFAVGDVPSAVENVLRNGINEAELPVAAFRHWEIFRAGYVRDLPTFAIDVACAFVEAARAHGGVAIFMCAEECCSSFDILSRDDQDNAYCHRYTLAATITKAFEKLHPNAVVKRLEVTANAP